ncbi:MAG TPA: zinc finger domain-containing protein, partial [Ktedonobacterales bacterium]
GAQTAGMAALGPEPLAPEFTPAALGARLAGRRRGIKALLLDQTAVAGLGNIYADEALWRARIHPLRPAGSLSPAEVRRLHEGIRGALETGIEHGGTTFGRHRDVNNEAGRNLEHVAVYRRTGQPCPRCGTPIQRITVAQRGTHFCPHCQPLPRP